MPEMEPNATITRRVDVGPSNCVIQVRPDSGQVPAFEPGQHVQLGLPRLAEAGGAQPGDGRPRLVRRPYSIASAADVRGQFEFFVVLIEEGRLTPHLWQIEEGGRVWLGERVHGDFTLDPVPSDAGVVFVSTGTGLGPFLSMLRTYRGRGRWRRLTLINGVRYARDLGYRAELEQVAREDSDFRYIPIVSREPLGSDWHGLTGRVQSVLEPDRFRALAGTALDPQHDHVFLCGNPAMVDECDAMLRARGFREHKRDRPGNLHFERYW